jgi:NAD(P)H-hydrate epimerase
MRALAKRLELPLVVDADGLFALSEEPGALKARAATTVLTPHPGEAARLLGSRAAEVNADRVGAARALASATGAVVLLKGAATIAASPEGRVIVNPTGGPALAAGGTGDVLAGVVAAYLAQGLPGVEAAALAAFVHGAAGDRLGRLAGGLLAGDLAAELPATAARLKALSAADRPMLVAEAGAGLALPLPGS